jgi:pyridoxamine 5'-phosphate oxidase family protein
VTGRDFARSRSTATSPAPPRPPSSSTIWPAQTTDPWRPRGIEIRGRAETVTEPHELIRIYPDRVIAWGLDE